MPGDMDRGAPGAGRDSVSPRSTPKSTLADEMLTARDLATLMHRTEQWVYDIRHRGGGPRAIKPEGGKLLFRRSDVDAWLERCADPEAV